MIPVAWFRTDSSWDDGFPRYVLDNAALCKHFLIHPEALEKWSSSVDRSIAVFVIPGQHSLNDVQEINEAARDFEKVIFIVNGDEEALLDMSKLQHPNKKLWSFVPPFNPKQQVDRLAPFGWPLDGDIMIKKTVGTIKWSNQWQWIKNNRDLPWSFIGQVTHQRRQECRLASWGLPKTGLFISTDGFGQGLSRENYYESMVRSKFVLCPSGPRTPDTFRFAEALEAGCVPIVDNRTPNPNYPKGYWNYVFGMDEFPFPLVDDWQEVPDLFEGWLKDFDRLQALCCGWWMGAKYRMISQMRKDLE